MVDHLIACVFDLDIREALIGAQSELVNSGSGFMHSRLTLRDCGKARLQVPPPHAIREFLILRYRFKITIGNQSTNTSTKLS